MSDRYLVTAYEVIRTVYSIEADSPEDARTKLETNEHGYDVVQEEYHDRDRIDPDVEEVSK